MTRPRLGIGLPTFRRAGGLVPLVGALLALASASASAAQREGSFSCRASGASALRIEPFVANAAGDPCTSDSKTVTNPTNFQPYATAGGVTVQTSAPDVLLPPAVGDAATSQAEITNPKVITGLPFTGSASDVKASAQATCTAIGPGRTPVLTGSSSATDVVIDQIPRTVNGPTDLPVPGFGVIHFNSQQIVPVTGGEEIIQRAVWFQDTSGTVGDVIIGEAIADYHGNPCTEVLPTSKEQCKDGGWKTFGVFKNQGDCVSFVATRGRNQPG